MPTRRSILASALGTLAVSGCLEEDEEWEEGDLSINNHATFSITVRVTLERYYESPRDDVPLNAPPPEEDPISQRESTFDIGAGGSVHESGYVDEAGTYYASTAVEGGDSGHTWAVFYEAAGDVYGGPILVAHVDSLEQVVIYGWSL